MKKSIIKHCFLLCLLAASFMLVGCQQAGNEPSSTADESAYTKQVNTSGETVGYVDNSVLYTQKDKAKAKKVMDQTQTYVSGVYAAVTGHGGNVVDTDFVTDLLLVQELEARAAYLASEYKDADTSSMVPYIKFETVDIKEDAAKVIVSYSVKNPDTDDIALEQRDAYLYIKEGNNWKLNNVIFDTGHGGDKIIEKLEKEDNPDAWKNEYSYQNLKRSDYENAPDYKVLVEENG